MRRVQAGRSGGARLQGRKAEGEGNGEVSGGIIDLGVVVAVAVDVVAADVFVWFVWVGLGWVAEQSLIKSVLKLSSFNMGGGFQGKLQGLAAQTRHFVSRRSYRPPNPHRPVSWGTSISTTSHPIPSLTQSSRFQQTTPWTLRPNPSVHRQSCLVYGSG